MLNKETKKRFWANVRKTKTCWLWTGGLVSGYGRLWLGTKDSLAHRLSWKLHYGLIPNRLWVLHKCDVRNCVNPDHLFLGTNQDNQLDALRKGRLATGDRHWTHLHPERVARGKRQGAHTHPELRVHGECHGNVKLTARQVRQIRKRAANGTSAFRMVSDYPVTERAIKFIIDRVNWKHIE